MRALLSTGQRDRSRLVLTVLSGTLAAATVAGTGIATAAAAQESARSNAVKARHKAEAEAAAAKAHHEALLKWAKENPVVVTKARPKKTVIGKPTLVKASSSGSSRVGGGSSSTLAIDLGEHRGATVKRMSAPSVDEKDAGKVTWAGQSCGKYQPRDRGPRPPAGLGARLAFTWTVVADRSPGA